MKTIIQQGILALLLTLAAQNGLGFELLSEGAMGSVSATTETHLHDTTTFNEESAIDYELMPFQTSVQIEHGDTDEVSEDLEFEFSKEIESWASKLQDSQSYIQEIATIDAIQAPIIEEPTIDTSSALDSQTVEISLGTKSDDIRFVQGRITQTAQLLEAQENSVRYSVETFVERAATLNANPFQEEHSFGSTYISDLRSVSNVTITTK